MTVYEVTISVRTVHPNDSLDYQGIERKFSFQDNEVFILAGAANAVMQTAQELYDTLDMNRQGTGGKQLSNGTSGWPVKR
jgi:hypothetical protein